MSHATESEILEVLRVAAFLAVGLFFTYHVVRYIVICINRGIDRDLDATYRQLGHHRYVDPDEVTDGQRGIDWLHQRCPEPRERRTATQQEPSAADRRPCGPRTPHGSHSSRDSRGPYSSYGLPGRLHAVARPASRPVVVVSGGAFAGARVRVLLESREWAGLWFVELIDGRYRGTVTVVDSGWISDIEY